MAGDRAGAFARRGAAPEDHPAARFTLDRRALSSRCPIRILPGRGWPRCCGRESVRARLREARAGARARAAILSGIPCRHEPRRPRGRCVQLPGVLGIHVAVVVGAGHGAPPSARQCAGGVHLSGHGELRHARPAAGLRSAGRHRRRLRLCGHARAAPFSGHRCAGALPDPARRRLQGRARAAARLASARASGSPQPRFRADERRHDQGRRLCLRAHRVRPARRSGVVVEHARAGARRHHLRDGRAVCADAARPQAALGLSYGGEYRDHLHRIRLGTGLRGPRHGLGSGAGAHRRAPARAQPCGVQEPAVLRCRCNSDCHRRTRHGAAGRPHSPHAAHRIRVSGRLRRNFGAAAAQRVCIGMADLPGHPAQSAIAVVGAQVAGAGGRCPACALRSSCRRLLRQSLRPDLSRPPAYGCRRQCRRKRSVLAGCDVPVRRPVPDRRHPPRNVH